MAKYFSKRGAKKGFFLSGIFILAWSSWAIGFTQGAKLSESTSVIWFRNLKG